MTEIVTPYALAAVYVVCLVLAERESARVRIGAVGLWASCLALATLIMYRAAWIGWERTLLNILWAGVITLSLIWALLLLRRPSAPLPPAATFPHPPNYVPPEPEQQAGGQHWQQRTRRIRYRVVTRRRK